MSARTHYLRREDEEEWERSSNKANFCYVTLLFGKNSPSFATHSREAQNSMKLGFSLELMGLVERKGAVPKAYVI